MKILHTVEFYFPSQGGMQEVVKQLSERLVLLGHDVTVATKKLSQRNSNFINGVHIREFDISGNSANGITGEVNAYTEFLLHADFDIVTNFAAQQWATDVALPLLDSIKAKKVFVPTGFSGLYNPVFKAYFEKMKEWMKKYDMNVFLSDDYRDVNFAKEIGINRRILIPNGAGENEFSKIKSGEFRKKMGIPENAFLLLHVGSYTGIKGHKEALEIFLAASIPGSFLLLVGDRNEKFAHEVWRNLNVKAMLKYILFGRKNSRITTLSRDMTVEAYLEADVFLFPSNIECSPIVLFESMASGTPFLTTDVGNSVEIVSWSQSGIVLPTQIDSEGYSHANIKASAQLLCEFYSDKQLQATMSAAGKASWKENYSWEIISKKYLNLYQDLVNGNIETN